ncbi:MAG TPA: F0F1 ATP synthase subunit B [Candidatus Paceibacterota bacterium]
MSELFSNLGINGKLLFAQAVNFLLVLWLLNKFVFKKLITHLEKRRARIEQGLELTAKAEREMGRIEDSRHRELEKGRLEGEKVLAEARTISAAKGKEALALVKAEAEKMLVKAKQESEKEKAETLLRSKGEIQKLAVLMAEKVLSRSVTKEDEERAAKEVLGYLEKTYAAK